MSVTSPAILSRAANQPAQSGAILSGRAAANSGTNAQDDDFFSLFLFVDRRLSFFFLFTQIRNWSSKFKTCALSRVMQCKSFPALCCSNSLLCASWSSSSAASLLFEPVMSERSGMMCWSSDALSPYRVVAGHHCAEMSAWQVSTFPGLQNAFFFPSLLPILRFLPLSL